MRNAVAATERTGNRVIPTWVFTNLADIEARTGHTSSARETLGRAMDHAVGRMDELGMVLCIEGAAGLAEIAGRCDDATALAAFASAHRQGGMFYEPRAYQAITELNARLHAADAAQWATAKRAARR